MNYHLNEPAGLARLGLHLPQAEVVAYLSESVCRARFQPERGSASFAELLSSHADQIGAAMSRRFAQGPQSIFVLRPGDF